MHLFNAFNVQGERLNKRLLLELHFYKDLSHLTALLGRKCVEVLATQLNPRFKSIQCPTWLKLPLVVKHQKIEYGVSVKLRDWSSLDSTADSLQALYKRLNLGELPPLNTNLESRALEYLVFKKLGLAQLNFSQSLAKKLGLEEIKINETQPSGLGTLISKVYKNWVQSQVPLSKDLLQKLDFNQRPKTHNSFTALLSSLYGINGFVKSSSDELTKSHLGVILGGRVGSEKQNSAVAPDEIVIDLDIQSAYGSAMAQMPIALGHPTLFYYPRERKDCWPTLGEFLKQWKKEFVPFCWSLVVDTKEKFSFDQKLIYSKEMSGYWGNPTLEEDDDSAPRRRSNVLIIS